MRFAMALKDVLRCCHHRGRVLFFLGAQELTPTGEPAAAQPQLQPIAQSTLVESSQDKSQETAPAAILPPLNSEDEGAVPEVPQVPEEAPGAAPVVPAGASESDAPVGAEVVPAGASESDAQVVPAGASDPDVLILVKCFICQLEVNALKSKVLSRKGVAGSSTEEVRWQCGPCQRVDLAVHRKMQSVQFLRDMPE